MRAGRKGEGDAAGDFVAGDDRRQRLRPARPRHLGRRQRRRIPGRHDPPAGPHHLAAVADIGGDAGDAAGQRLEDPDRRNPRQSLAIRLPRYVQRDPGAGIGRGRPRIGQISGICNARRFQPPPRIRWIAHSIRLKAMLLQPPRRLQQIFLQLSRPFFIAPVADPDHFRRVIFPRFIRRGLENAEIGGLVQGITAPDVKSGFVHPPQALAKGHHRVKFVHLTGRNFVRPADAAVVRIVPDQPETELMAQTLECLNQRRVAPFMRHHPFHIPQWLFEK